MEMEFIDGTSIDDYCDKRKLPRSQVLSLFLAAVEAIGKAHDWMKNDQPAPIVHADIKPTHLLVTNAGVVKIIDFGLGVLSDDTQSLRGFTYAFGSPEQKRGERPTAASDVYALGKVLRRLLDAAPPKTWRERFVAPECEAIVERCLQQAPDARYQSATALASDLRSHLEWREVSSYVRGGLKVRTQKFALRHPVIVATAVTMGLSASASAVWWLANYQERLAIKTAKTAVELLSEDPQRALRLASLAADLSDAPEVVWALRRSIGNPIQQVMRIPEGRVENLAFSVNGQLLAVASDTGQISLFHVNGGKPIWSGATGLSDGIGGIAMEFLGDDQLLELNNGRELWYVDLSRPELFFAVSELSTLEKVKTTVDSPSGAWAASLASDGTLTVSDAGTSRIVKRAHIGLSAEAVTWLQFSDDSLLMVGTVHGRMGLWRWREQEDIVWYQPHHRPIRQGFASIGGRWIGTQCADGVSRVWDSQSGKTVAWRSLKRRSGFPEDIGRVVPLGPVPLLSDLSSASSQQSTFLQITGPQNREKAMLRGVDTLADLTEFATTKVSESSDGQLIVVANDHELRIWDNRTMAWASGPATEGTYRAVRFAPSTHSVVAVSNSDDEPSVIVNADTNAVESAWLGPKYWHKTAFNVNGQFVLAVGQHETVVVDVTSGDHVFSQTVSAGSSTAVAIDSTGEVVAAGGDQGNTIRIWRMSKPVQLVGERDPRTAGTMAFDASGRYLAAAAAGKTSAWDMTTREHLFSAQSSQDSPPLTRASFDTANHRLMVVNERGGVELWDLLNGSIALRCCEHSSTVKDARFSPNGAFIATQQSDDESFLWDAKTGAMLRHISVSGQSLSGPSSFSPDSRYLTTAIAGQMYREDVMSLSDRKVSVVEGEEKPIKVVQVAMGRKGLAWTTRAETKSEVLWLSSAGADRPFEIERGSRWMRLGGFSSSGRLLAAMVENGVRVWNTQNGALLGTFSREPLRELFEATISSDDQFVSAVAASEPGAASRICVWNIATGMKAFDVPGVAGAISPDGQGVAVVSHGRVLWYATPQFGGSLSGLKEYARHKLEPRTSSPTQ
jgi:WD40 repeat protein